jgi:RNA polymerase sigma-70 factor (ECF subfamily)
VTSDAELIGWSLAGEDETFVEVMRRHEAVVWGYVARRVGRGSAEDLMSDVWVAAFGARSSYDQEFPDARPWLFGIARNVLRRHWRSRPNENLEADMAAIATGNDPWPAVDEQIDGATVLRRALTNLRPAEREVLLLVAWEGLSIADAARTLDLPAGTARYHLHRARAALRDAPGIVALLTDCNAVTGTK